MVTVGQSRRNNLGRTDRIEEGDARMGLRDKAKDLATKVTHKATEVAGELADKAGPLAEKAKPLAEKAKPLAEKVKPLAAKGISVAASSANKVTGGKYHDKIDNMSEKLGNVLGAHTKPKDTGTV
jgi:antitoxin protein of toxin-antitoxin system